MPCAQIIEYETSRIDELSAAHYGWLEATRAAQAATARRAATPAELS